MVLPANIREFLDREQVSYQMLPHARTSTLAQAAQACEVPVSQLVRAVVLADERGLLMAVLPADHVLDFAALRAVLQRDVDLVAGNLLESIFDGCEPRSYPPLAPAYNLDVVVDSAVADLEMVTFEPGVHTTLIQVSQRDFRRLLGRTSSGSFSRSAASLRADSGDPGSTLGHMVDQFAPARIKHDIDEFHELPALPPGAAQLLQLSAPPGGGEHRLAQIIEQDPGLAAQVLRYANAYLHAYADGVSDIPTSIARAPGFEFVLKLALGLSICGSLRVPEEGPFGQIAFWRHAIYAGRLAEQLALRLPAQHKPSSGSAHLAGLLQNLGRLVLGHTFQPEFYILNRFAQANPAMPTLDLERQVLGVTHTRIGAWLMEAWGLPPELVTAIHHHHDEDYWGEYATCSQLVLIANRALAAHGIGETDRPGLPGFSLEMLGLDEFQVAELTDRLIEQGDEIEALARHLTA
jgi:HD-like signal output (HDOD) protein/prolyl-tRNA editing enzyme YbaK/EbsC (Cys-tRNA(Pro) deacylase)